MAAVLASDLRDSCLEHVQCALLAPNTAVSSTHTATLEGCALPSFLLMEEPAQHVEVKYEVQVRLQTLPDLSLVPPAFRCGGLEQDAETLGLDFSPL